MYFSNRITTDVYNTFSICVLLLKLLSPTRHSPLSCLKQWFSELIAHWGQLYSLKNNCTSILRYSDDCGCRTLNSVGSTTCWAPAHLPRAGCRYNTVGEVEQPWEDMTCHLTDTFTLYPLYLWLSHTLWEIISMLLYLLLGRHFLKEKKITRKSAQWLCWVLQVNEDLFIHTIKDMFHPKSVIRHTHMLKEWPNWFDDIVCG